MLVLACGSPQDDMGLRVALPTAEATPQLTPTAGTATAWRWPSASAVTATSEATTLPAEDEPPAPVDVTSAVKPGDADGWLLEVPDIGVRASTAVFGLDAAGVMEVPADHVTVAWYDFTSVPGRAGNAVLAAHVNWRGEQGVFSRLGEVSVGARVDLTAPTGERVTYRIESVELVDLYTADVGAIVGSREGAPTLTLITCGGTFNRDTREYEHRVIVRAALVGERGGL